ncbi:MAG: MOSC domain-containing protein [Pseudomonadota bacterium]
METLASLIARHAQNGTLDWIGLRPQRRAAMLLASRTKITFDGLDGDRARSGKRAVTLLQAEHLAVIAGILGKPVSPDLLRRNLLISGINLSALRGKCLQIGDATIEITGPCAPCSRMEHALGPGGYTAMRGHGGWCAAVLRPGAITIGDAVRPVEPARDPVS